MKRLFTILALCMVATSYATDDAALQVLRNIRQRFAGSNSYRVTYAMRMGGNEYRGVLHVEGSASYMNNGKSEVYISDGVRYEVNAAKREVVVGNVSAYGGDLLGNLSRGVQGILSDFDVTLSQYDGVRALRLMPRGGKYEEEAAYILLNDDDTVRCITFGTGGGKVELLPLDINISVGAAPRFDVSKYQGFEVIDFR